MLTLSLTGIEVEVAVHRVEGVGILGQGFKRTEMVGLAHAVDVPRANKVTELLASGMLELICQEHQHCLRVFHFL